MKIFQQTDTLGMVDITRKYNRMKKLTLLLVCCFITIIGTSFMTASEVEQKEKVVTVIQYDTIRELGIFRTSDLVEITVPRNANVPTFCNNPGALRPSSIKEVNALAIGSIEVPSGRFLYFANKEHGFKALELVLRKVYWNTTIKDMMRAYAPDFENNTAKYAADLSLGTGVTINTKVKNCDLTKLMKTIAKIEGFKK